jgi:hypothetical protein
MRLYDDRVIAPTAAALRVGARVLLERGQSADMLSFRFADTHLHVFLGCGGDQARRFAHHTAIALQRKLRLAAPFEPTRVRPVVDQRHLYSTFRYVLRQEARHGLVTDPAHDGSSLPDLVGMRVVDPSHPQTVRSKLPRLDRREVAVSLGIAFAPLEEAPATLLPVAAAAALALADLARTRAAGCVLARRAAVHAAAKVLRTSTLSELLEVSPRSIQRLREERADPLLVRAVELQWRFRASLAARGLSAC